MLETMFLGYNRSEIAAAALILSSKRLSPWLHIWSAKIAEKTGYTESSLTGVVNKIKRFLSQVNPAMLSNLKNKFNKVQYGSVGNLLLEF